MGERLRDRWASWPYWSGWAAAVWSLGYGLLGLYWALGGAGFPFGVENDYEASDVNSVLAGVTTGSAAPAVAALGALGAVAGLLMARTVGRGALRAGLVGLGWAYAVGLTLVVPDLRLLMLLTRLPFIALSPFFGMPGGRPVSDFLPWPRLNLAVVVLGGLLWAMATLAYQRRTGDACANCGRDGRGADGWTSPGAARRWGRWAVAVAVAVPLAYASTRIAWGLGIRLGIKERFYQEYKDTGMFVGGAVIGLMAVGGAVLTLGLVQRWGEVFPRWIWFLRGRRVPPALAIVPATLVAVFVVPASVSEIRRGWSGGLHPHPDGWALTAPGWFFPLWGPALGAAAYAYHLRRRGTCRHCGRGAPEGADDPARRYADLG